MRGGGHRDAQQNDQTLHPVNVGETYVKSEVQENIFFCVANLQWIADSIEVPELINTNTNNRKGQFLLVISG